MRRFLTVLMAICFSAAAANAQQAKTSLPDAPKAAVYLANASPGAAIGSNYAAPSPAQTTQPSGTISLYTVVDLALRNSRAVLISEAAQKRAISAWAETRHAYIPNFVLGSGLGPPSYGFPLGFPTLFNVTSTGLAFSFSQRDYTRSAKAAAKSAALRLKDTRQKVILDTAQTYIELATDEHEISALHQASSDAATLVSILQDRLRAGLQSELDVTNAQLTRAQIDLRAIQLEDHADELRQHLSNLTGLPQALLDPSASTIPLLPDLDFHTLLQNSVNAPSVQAAEAMADSKMFNAWGDKRQNFRPTIGYGFQYALFAPYTGYQTYYPKYQPNNIESGIQMTWPLFDATRRDKALQSKAAAEEARHKAELARIQNSEADLALVHSLRELKARARVAELQQRIAKETLASTVTRMSQSPTSAGAPPVTPQQTEQVRIEERTRYADLQEADWSVIRVKLDLLNAVGRLEDWVRQQPPSSDSMKK